MQAFQRALLTARLPVDLALTGVLQRAAAAGICTTARSSPACQFFAHRIMSPVISIRGLWSASPAAGMTRRQLSHHACFAQQLIPSSHANAAGLQRSISSVVMGLTDATLPSRDISSSAAQRTSGSVETGTDLPLPAAAPNADAEAAASPTAPRVPGKSVAPWTFTRHLGKRKIYTKRMATMLTVRRLVAGPRTCS